MKTTVEVPDKLYRQVKAFAASKGLTVKAFLLDAIQDKLCKDSSSATKTSGWRAVFGKANREDMAKLQRVIDAEFSQVDPEGWQ